MRRSHRDDAARNRRFAIAHESSVVYTGAVELFELLIGLLFAGAVLTSLAQKIGAPYPALLALAGTVLALLPPEIPAIRLNPDLALTLFVAPVLLDAAFDASPRDLRDNWVPVTSLVLIAVALTVAAVAVVAHRFVPDLPWAAAIALGAIVAPPDAVAATSVLRQLSPPHRLMVILEGEGLLNDASALLIYRFAVGVALGTALTPWTAIPTFLLNSVGSVVLGLVLGLVFQGVTHRVTDLAISVVLQFVGTFAVWIIAERVGASSVLTMVVYAVFLARGASERQNAENRRGSYAVWEVAVFVLNALAFLLVGLQLQEILKHVEGGVWPYLTVAGAVLATVIVVRLVWVMAFNALVRAIQSLSSTPPRHPTSTARSYKAALVVGWCGMRGLLTLATVLALPIGGNGVAGFPHRDLLVTVAFAVVVGTLVLQGLTVGPLMRWLKLSSDGTVERELDFARQQATRAALASLEGVKEPEAAILRKEYNVVLQDEAMQWLRPKVFGRLRMTAIEAERVELQRLRRDREIGDDAYHAIEEELDWAEGNARRRARPVPRSTDKQADPGPKTTS